jgi:hypothetical protein
MRKRVRKDLKRQGIVGAEQWLVSSEEKKRGPPCTPHHFE